VKELNLSLSKKISKTKDKKYVLCISGSRSLTDYSLIDKAIIYARINIADIKEIISGGAKGVDTNAKKYAEFYKIKFKEYPADWKNLKAKDAIIVDGPYGKYNKRAGFLRNELMAEKADKLLAIWDGKSYGTQHEIECFKKLKKEYFVYQDDSQIEFTKTDGSVIMKDKEQKGVEGKDYFIF
jgi:hypothetical protein